MSSVEGGSPVETAVQRLIAAAERGGYKRAIAALEMTLTTHYLVTVECDHAARLDKPWCSCSLVNLGWHPSVGEAVKAWVAHVLAEARKS